MSIATSGFSQCRSPFLNSHDDATGTSVTGCTALGAGCHGTAANPVLTTVHTTGCALTRACHGTSTYNPGVDIQVADLPTQGLPAGTKVDFTFYWPEAGHWEGKNYMVQITKEKK